jgi:hypothetical protein
MFVTQFPVRGNYLAMVFLAVAAQSASWHEGGILVDRVSIGSCPSCEELQEHRPFLPDQRAISRRASS